MSHLVYNLGRNLSYRPIYLFVDNSGEGKYITNSVSIMFMNKIIQLIKSILSSLSQIFNSPFIHVIIFLSLFYCFLRFLNIDKEQTATFMIILSGLSGYYIINILEISRKRKNLNFVWI